MHPELYQHSKELSPPTLTRRVRAGACGRYYLGAFTLPPTLRRGNKTRQPYRNIGTADRVSVWFSRTPANPKSVTP